MFKSLLIIFANLTVTSSHAETIVQFTRGQRVSEYVKFYKESGELQLVYLTNESRTLTARVSCEPGGWFSASHKLMVVPGPKFVHKHANVRVYDLKYNPKECLREIDAMAEASVASPVLIDLVTGTITTP